MSKIHILKNLFENNPTFSKLFIIAGLTLLLLIPVEMIKSLITERNERLVETQKEISKTWGKEQVVGGPILTIPYQKYRVQNTRNNSAIKYAHFLPRELNISGKIQPEVRHRGIFKVPVYTTDLTIQGDFARPDFSKLKINENRVLWDKAFLSFRISDMKGAIAIPKLDWNKSTLQFAPATERISGLNSVIQVNLPEFSKNRQSQNRFSFNLKMAGSRALRFLPFGQRTTVSLSSSWETPKFSGMILPIRHEVTDNGFTANWSTLELVRNYPQQWCEDKIGSETLLSSTFGVDLLFPVSTYQQITRSVKYASLFIILTFLTFFLFETLNEFRIHPIQYLLIGLGICLFYLNLLSMSEHFGFKLAYACSTASVILLISVYGITVIKSTLRALIVAFILLVLYAFLYILLMAETYSLMMGSSGMFLILAVVMFITRKIDWYNINTTIGQQEIDTIA